MMMMMMNCCCDLVERWKAFSLISSQDHCLRSSPLWISDTPQVGLELVQNLNAGLVQWSCAVVITTMPQHHIAFYQYLPPHINAHPKLRTVQNHVPTIFFHYKEFGFRGSPFPLKIGIVISTATQRAHLLSRFSYDWLHTTPLQPQFFSLHPLLY